MTSNDAAKNKMKAALQRLDDAVTHKLSKAVNTGATDDVDSLKTEINKLKEENIRLRNINQSSVKKLDMAIDRMNNIINAN